MGPIENTGYQPEFVSGTVQNGPGVEDLEAEISILGGKLNELLMWKESVQRELRALGIVDSELNGKMTLLEVKIANLEDVDG